MTKQTLKSQVEAKLAELANQSNLLSEIEDACEENQEYNLAEIIRAEQDELTAWRKAVRTAYEKI